MNITEHFTFAELTESDYAQRHGIHNQPDSHLVISNLHALAHGLERIRAIFNKPVIVKSAYRSAKVNAAVGGHPNSYHTHGLAADIIIPGISAGDAAYEISLHVTDYGIDQLIHEGSWVHIGYPLPGVSPRNDILTAIFKHGQPTVYLKGII